MTSLTGKVQVGPTKADLGLHEITGGRQSAPRHTVTEDIGLSQVVPVAALADLNYVDLESAELGCHRPQLITSSDPTGVGPEFVAIHVGDSDKALITANRARQGR